MKYAVIYTSDTGNTEELAKNIFVSPWINDDCSYLGFFMCQGKASEKFREKLEVETGYSTEELDRIIKTSEAHPDDNDIDRLCEFVDSVAE